MKNIILLTSIVLIPFVTLASNLEEINKLMDKIKTNSESYRLICYANSAGKWWINIELSNGKEYCAYLKNIIEHDINDVLELDSKK
jgi:hypothetical protein